MVIHNLISRGPRRRWRPRPKKLEPADIGTRLKQDHPKPVPLIPVRPSLHAFPPLSTPPKHTLATTDPPPLELPTPSRVAAQPISIKFEVAPPSTDTTISDARRRQALRQIQDWSTDQVHHFFSRCGAPQIADRLRSAGVNGMSLFNLRDAEKFDDVSLDEQEWSYVEGIVRILETRLDDLEIYTSDNYSEDVRVDIKSLDVKALPTPPIKAEVPQVEVKDLSLFARALQWTREQVHTFLSRLEMHDAASQLFISNCRGEDLMMLSSDDIQDDDDSALEEFCDRRTGRALRAVVDELCVMSPTGWSHVRQVAEGIT